MTPEEPHIQRAAALALMDEPYAPDGSPNVFSIRGYHTDGSEYEKLGLRKWQSKPKTAKSTDGSSAGIKYSIKQNKVILVREPQAAKPKALKIWLMSYVKFAWQKDWLRIIHPH